MTPLLLDSISINTGLAAAVITSMIGSFTAIGLAFLKYSSNINKSNNDRVMGKLDEMSANQRELEAELRPLATTLAEHSVELRNLKENLAETNKWVGKHDSDIQAINRQLKNI